MIAKLSKVCDRLNERLSVINVYFFLVMMVCYPPYTHKIRTVTKNHNVYVRVKVSEDFMISVRKQAKIMSVLVSGNYCVIVV